MYVEGCFLFVLLTLFDYNCDILLEGVSLNVFFFHSSQVYVADESTVADHCMTYALSDTSDSSFRQQCQHVHDEHCRECENLDAVLDEVHTFFEWVSLPSKDDCDEAIYVTKHTKEMIEAWKAHQLRTVFILSKLYLFLY